MSESSFQDDVLNELGDEKLTEIAGLLGTDANGARDAVAETVGAMTGDLQQKAGADDDDGAEVRQAFAEVSDAPPPLQGVATLGGGLGGLLGGGMMAGVLAKVSKPVANAVSKKTGIPAATISRVIEVLIPVVLAVFAKRAAAGKAGAGSPTASGAPAPAPRRGRRRARRPAGPDPGRRQEVGGGRGNPYGAGRAGAFEPSPGAAPRAILGLHGAPAERPADHLAAAVRLRDPQPGDLGWIVQRHGALYAAEYGWNQEFEGLVARIVADFAEDHDPYLERVWIAEHEGRPVGSVMCVREDGAPGTARLRLLLVEPGGRRLGVGTLLVDTVVAFARSVGYRELVLWTNDVLVPARSLYTRAGFTLVAEHAHRSYGADLTGQDWRLPLRENSPR